MVTLSTSTSLASIPGIVHGFTSRVGGVSLAPKDSLHLGFQDGVAPEELLENYTRAVHALHPTLSVGKVAVVNQVHGNKVQFVDRPAGPLNALASADGLIALGPSMVLLVRIADCVPVLLATSDGRAIGAVHSGWRGTASAVVRHAVRALRLRAPDSPSIVAAIGPHVSLNAYEVSEEVVGQISKTGVDRSLFAERRGAAWHVSLGAAVAWQLRREGVDIVEQVGGCTSNPEWFSHRHDGPDTGRQAAMIARLS